MDARPWLHNIQERAAQRSRTSNDPSPYFEDSTLIYIRDRHGTFYSPPGYEGNKTSPKLLQQDPLKVVHGPICAVKTTSTQQSPCKLYHICKNFVARNLHLVESLVGFPEVVGYDIFQEAIQSKVLHQNPEYLPLFCMAYESLVLKHLGLKQSTVVINENFHILQCFNNLTKLDLAHCRLGDKHECLQWIGKMKSLQSICLKDNCLTDTGISSWTLPHRMFKAGPELLGILDLSCNPKLTDVCVKCLVKFTQLKSLNLSGTSITITCGIQKIMKLTNLKLVSYIPDFSKEVFTKTKGWASLFISELSSSSCTKPSVPKPDNQVKINFFKRTTAFSAVPPVQVNKVNECSIDIENYPTLLLQSEELVLPDTLRDIDSNSLGKKNKKRIEVDNERVLHPSRKKRKLTSLENNKNIDDELVMTGVENLQNSSCSLLESYLKYL